MAFDNDDGCPDDDDAPSQDGPIPRGIDFPPDPGRGSKLERLKSRPKRSRPSRFDRDTEGSDEPA
jgi:hypothetical protein